MEAHFSEVGDSLTWQLYLPLDFSMILPLPWEAELALGCRWLHLSLDQTLSTSK